MRESRYLRIIWLCLCVALVIPYHSFAADMAEKNVKDALINKDWNKVIEATNAWKEEGNSPVPNFVLAYAYYVMGNYQKVSKYLDSIDSQEKKQSLLTWTEEFASEYQKNPIPYLLKGDVCTRLKNYGDALKEFGKAEELEPNFFLVYVEKGMVYSFQNNFDEAIKNFSRAIELNPKAADAYNNRGIAYFSKGDYALALNDFNQAIKINPEFNLAYIGRGKVYHSLGKEPLASGDFEKAAKIGFGSKWSYERNIDTNRWQLKSITPEIKIKTPILEGVSTKSEGKIIKAEEGGTVSEKALGDNFITSSPSFLLYNDQFLSKTE